jgi:trehalose utilization protein
MSDIRVTVWNEFLHEKSNATSKKIYPNGMHEAIAGYLRKQKGLTVRTATLDEDEHGLTEQVLAETDVLTWWGHRAHNDVRDDVVDRVQQRVLEGMGLLVLHSGHVSKIFRRMMGTGCQLRWREAAERERIWVANPAHPIARGLGPYIELPNTEMYGEHFDIPEPDELVFISWFEGGEVFRSGATWVRGHGKVVYFRPGHETYPIYHDQQVLKVIENAVRWAAFDGNAEVRPYYGKRCDPLEELSRKDYEQEPIDHPTN